ncbi:MAG: XisI protein [Anaerolineae bacterium]|nr:XisI protein [Anaerolineae bacterium]
MDTLTQILKESVRAYAGNGRGANILLFPILDDDHQIYAVTAVDYPTRDDVALVMVLARVVGDVIVIEEDTTDKKLVDALLQRGISRQQIVLAYLGEPLPDAEKYILDPQ